MHCPNIGHVPDPLALARLALATSRVAGRLDQTPDASDGAADVVALNDAGTESGTKCEAPSGVSICGGPHDCGAECQTCTGGDASVRAGGDVNYDFDAGGSTLDSYVCPDGAMVQRASTKVVYPNVSTRASRWISPSSIS